MTGACLLGACIFKLSHCTVLVDVADAGKSHQASSPRQCCRNQIQSCACQVQHYWHCTHALFPLRCFVHNTMAYRVCVLPGSIVRGYQKLMAGCGCPSNSQPGLWLWYLIMIACARSSVEGMRHMCCAHGLKSSSIGLAIHARSFITCTAWWVLQSQHMSVLLCKCPGDLGKLSEQSVSFETGWTWASSECLGVWFCLM